MEAETETLAAVSFVLDNTEENDDESETSDTDSEFECIDDLRLVKSTDPYMDSIFFVIFFAWLCGIIKFYALDRVYGIFTKSDNCWRGNAETSESLTFERCDWNFRSIVDNFKRIPGPICELESSHNQKMYLQKLVDDFLGERFIYWWYMTAFCSIMAFDSAKILKRRKPRLEIITRCLGKFSISVFDIIKFVTAIVVLVMIAFKFCEAVKTDCLNTYLYNIFIIFILGLSVIYPFIGRNTNGASDSHDGLWHAWCNSFFLQYIVTSTLLYSIFLPSLKSLAASYENDYWFYVILFTSIYMMNFVKYFVQAIVVEMRYFELMDDDDDQELLNEDLFEAVEAVHRFNFATISLVATGVLPSCIILIQWCKYKINTARTLSQHIIDFLLLPTFVINLAKFALTDVLISNLHFHESSELILRQTLDEPGGIKNYLTMSSKNCILACILTGLGIMGPFTFRQGLEFITDASEANFSVLAVNIAFAYFICWMPISSVFKGCRGKSFIRERFSMHCETTEGDDDSSVSDLRTGDLDEETPERPWVMVVKVQEKRYINISA